MIFRLGNLFFQLNFYEALDWKNVSVIRDMLSAADIFSPTL